MKLLKTNIKHQFKELLMNSSIHGIRYTAEDHRTSIEKFMWFCIILISATSGLITISELWDKFQTNPTITGLDTDFTLLSIDFPTVVVCPIESYNNLSVYQVAGELVGNHMSDFESNVPLLQALTSLSYKSFKELEKHLATFNKNTTFWNRQTLRELVFKMRVNCEDIFEKCSFKNEMEQCCSVFKPIYTEKGFCYAYNSRYYATEFSEESNEELTKIHTDDDSWLLKIFLKEESDIFIYPSENLLTYDDTKLFTWRQKSAVDVLLSLKQTYTEADVDELSISQRKCIFPDKYDDSVTLTYYNDETYSFSYCMKECRMRAALKFCNCIPPFYAPENNDNYRKCLIEDFKCIANYSKAITSTNCRHCQLSCFDKSFEPEKISIVYKDDNHKDIKEKYVQITLSSWPTVQYKKEVLFGWIDLLVASGGTLGLFMGLSLLSVVEILYFMTIRVVFMFTNNADRLKDIHEEKEREAFTDLNYNLDLYLRKKQQESVVSTAILNSTFIMVSPYTPLSNLRKYD